MAAAARGSNPAVSPGRYPGRDGAKEGVMEHVATFGGWLSAYRQAVHLQRAELASRIGCAVVTLRKIEADERRPSREMAERLAEVLAIPEQRRDVFIRVARGELPLARLAIAPPAAPGATNLPAPTTALAGRAREIADIQAILARPEVRLLTLTGAPGVGKTRLALAAAQGLSDLFADGVFFVALASLSDPKLVLVTIAHALHVGTSGGQTLDERLGRYLRTRRVLLVLDNFEHLPAAAPHLSELLRAAPYLKLLVTSRVALELSGEHRFTVLPLAVPPAAEHLQQPLTAAEAQARYPAVALFLQRAQAVNPDLALTPAAVAAVGEICRRLDGLPLAIVLAAARTTLFTPRELLARLDDRFALLSAGARDLPARHMTLEAAIDWSYGLLAPADQQLFRRLSVFAGGCTLAAAQEVCNADSAVGRDVLGGITALVEGSLLQREAGADGQSRFEMLETIRAYAASLLAVSGEADSLRGQHAAYYLRLAQAAEQAWDGPAEWDWLGRLVVERDNLRAALRWALDTQDAALALRLNAGLFSFWSLCSALPEARRWVEAALALPRPADPDLAPVEAKVLHVAGYMATAMADYAQALDYFEQGLARYRALGDFRGIAWSIRSCAFAHMLREEHAVAGDLYTESLRLCEAHGDAWGHAWSLYALAFLQLAQGDLVAARPALENALVLLRRENMAFAAFRALLALGDALFEQGDLPGAEARYREALLLSRETPLLTFITTGLEGLGMIAGVRQQPLRAVRLWGAAAALREVTDERRWLVFQRIYDRAVQAARAQVPAAEWDAAWAAGRALPAAQAVAEALESAEPLPRLDDQSLLVGRTLIY
jgi:predicted ATPase/DNA-binding XRE family transcriptional regulator